MKLSCCLLENEQPTIEHLRQLDDGMYIFYAIKWPRSAKRFVYRVDPRQSKKIEFAFKKHQSTGKKAARIKAVAQGEPYAISETLDEVDQPRPKNEDFKHVSDTLHYLDNAVISLEKLALSRNDLEPVVADMIDAIHRVQGSIDRLKVRDVRFK